MKRISAATFFLILVFGMVGYVIQTTEAFQGNQDHTPQRCGVGLPPCRPVREGESVRCMNGWCRSDRIH